MFAKVNHSNLSYKNIFWFLLFTTVFLTEFILFKNYITREIIEFYPTAFDQTNYLKVAYTAYDNISKNGFWAGFKDTSTANSILFIPQAVLFFLIFGATRFNALLLNFIYFLLLQTSIVYLIRWLSGQYFMAAVAIGILLSVSVPFHLAGGIIDFRIDFLTICIYGIFLISVIRSDIFLNKKWSIVASLIAVYMVLTRCLTSTYLLIVVGMTFSYFLISLYRNPSNTIMKTRLKNILLFSCVLGFLTLPFLWYHKDFIYNYYVTLGAIKETGFRKLETQTLDLLSVLSYYPRSVLNDHMGINTIKMLELLSFLAVFYFVIKKLFFTHTTQSLNHINSLFIVNAFLVLSFLIPLTILTFYPSKSPSVGSITIVPVILFFVINATAFLKAASSSNKYLFLLTITFLSIGFYYWGENTHRNRGELYRNEAKQLNKMYDAIGEYIELNQWNNANVSTDQVSDYLSGLILTDLYYERHKKLLPITTTHLGNSVFSITEAEAEQILMSSDIYITNSGEYPASVYPFNKAMDAIRPVLNKIAEEKFIKLGTYHYNESYNYHTDHYFQVYAKPDFTINMEKLTLTIPQQVAERTSEIIISGKSKLKTLEPTQLVADMNALNATLSIKNYAYHIRISFNQKHEPLRQAAHITLRFPHLIKECINKNNTQKCLYAPESKKIIFNA